MEVYADLVEEFSQSLAELQDTLLVKVHKEDPIHASLVRDAQIFTFLRSSQVLKQLVSALHLQNSDQYYRTDIESILFSLGMLDILNDDHLDKLFSQFELAEFLTLDRSWLDTEEDQRLFEGGVCELHSYCKSMIILVQEISTKAKLIDRQEEPCEGH